MAAPAHLGSRAPQGDARPLTGRHDAIFAHLGLLRRREVRRTFRSARTVAERADTAGATRSQAAPANSASHRSQGSGHSEPPRPMPRSGADDRVVGRWASLHGMAVHAKTMPYVVSRTLRGHGKARVGVDRPGRIPGDRPPVVTAGAGASTGRWHAEHA